MTDVDQELRELFVKIAGVEELSRLSFRDIENDPTRVRYALVQERSNHRSTTRIFRVSWNPDERVVVFERPQSSSRQMVARITLDTAVGKDLELRHPTTSGRPGKPHYGRHRLLAAFSCNNPLAESDVKKLLAHYAKQQEPPVIG